jgi:hydrogenase maturation protein HypF
MAICELVAPRNPYLGIMLPYSPLHHLLLADLAFPVVATSGNISDEPICISEVDAVGRLRGIADLFLVHDRPIARYVDDSVVRLSLGRPLLLRRARGYAPLPITLREEAPPLLAVGAHVKNAVAVAAGKSLFLSQHIGDLQTAPAYEAFERCIADLRALYELEPEAVACDLHPHYLSTRYAEKTGYPVARVQHHYAHALSCMADNELQGPVLGVSWDGTGCGLDSRIWGGEFLYIKEGGFERVAHLRNFPLPGGEKAVEEPARSAVGILYEVYGPEIFGPSPLASLRAFSGLEKSILRTLLTRGLHSPLTSSAGRLFDAVASLLGLRQCVRFEAQAAMELEFAATEVETDEAYPVAIRDPSRSGDESTPAAARPALIVDWEPMIRAIVDDLDRSHPLGLIARRFHNALAEMIVEVARRANVERVVLSGGCFQNRALTERTVRRLSEEHFRPYWHQRIPPNDGGIAVGQLMAVLRERKERLCA